MKKIFLIVFVLIGFNSFSQSSLDGIFVNLTLRARDWAFIRGWVDPQDSLSILYASRLRDTVKAANPAPPYNATVRFNNIPAIIVYRMYVVVENQEAKIYKQNNMGTSVNTAIKAIVNTPLQNALTEFDNSAIPIYQSILIRGRLYLLD